MQVNFHVDCNRVLGDHGDCEHGDKGVWHLSEINAWTMAECIEHCKLSCPRCRYVSYANAGREHAECAWYHSCDTAHLMATPPGYRSGRVTRNAGGMKGRRRGQLTRTTEHHATHQGHPWATQPSCMDGIRRSLQHHALRCNRVSLMDT